MFDLYLITNALEPSEILRSVRAALDGVPPERVALQLRAKHLNTRELHALACELRAITRAAGVRLLVNDRADVARTSGADGVHLPEKGLGVRQARRVAGDGALVGVSCHDPEGLLRARDAGADFATLGPVFDTPGKGPALGVSRFAQEVEGVAGLPVYALGGVESHHAGELLAAGARGLAIIRGVFAAGDPAQAVREYLRAIDSARAASARGR